jgi:hypothetical protein
VFIKQQQQLLLCIDGFSAKIKLKKDDLGLGFSPLLDLPLLPPALSFQVFVSLQVPGMHQLLQTTAAAKTQLLTRFCGKDLQYLYYIE